jgi:hypothetical protein
MEHLPHNDLALPPNIDIQPSSGITSPVTPGSMLLGKGQSFGGCVQHFLLEVVREGDLSMSQAGAK